MSVSFLLMLSISTPFSSNTYVKIELLPQWSLYAPISCRNENEMIPSNVNIEFLGSSFITPVTMNWYLFSRVSDCPTGSVLPKYFFASFSVSIMEWGASSAVSGSPLMRGKVNILRSSESAATIADSKNTLSSILNSMRGSLLTRVCSFISGIFSFQTGPLGYGVTVT